MKRAWDAVLFAIVVVVGSGSLVNATPKEVDSVAAQPATIASDDSGANASGTTPAERESSAPVPAPLCTLIIKTTPESVSVSLDGTLFGLSPLMITNVATGPHIILLQKVGYFQKKVTLTLPAPGLNDLSFELAAPGRLVITTEPPEVTLQVNGIQRGTTPFIDSLIRPGTYSVTLSRQNYIPLEKTVVIPGGGVVHLNDTLSYTDEYRATLAVPVVKDRRKERRFTMGIVAGAFSLFLLILAIVETREK